jgi:2-keto-4-pentenoate hydratase/2-oxohepta-3-ene-1,7-dioic acid hydratase in catechol pathway
MKDGFRKRLARSATGALLLGTDDGFVPLASARPGTGVEDALAHAAEDTLPDPRTGTASPVAADEIAFGPPLYRPGKIWCIGLNFLDHADDLDEDRPDAPGSFMKPASTLTGPGGPIRRPPTDLAGRVTGEAELALVIGRTCKNVSVEAVDRVVAGCVPVIDVTAEDVFQKNTRFLTRSKSFDTFFVLGPWIETALPVDALGDLEVRTIVDGQVRAANTVDAMAFSPAELVAYHSRVMTLEPGDVISTGTPGAHPIEPGTTVRAEVDQVGAVEAAMV